MSEEIPAFYGASKVAQWCGVTNACVSNWLRRYTDYPRPAGIYCTPAQDYYFWSADQEKAWQEWMRPAEVIRPKVRRVPRPAPDAKPRHQSQ